MWVSEEYRFKRVLLKLSGEALMGDAGYGIDPDGPRRRWPARSRTRAPDGIEIAIVVGGGNIFRGLGRLGRAWTARRPTTWACSPRS